MSSRSVRYGRLAYEGLLEDRIAGAAVLHEMFTRVSGCTKYSVASLGQGVLLPGATLNLLFYKKL